MLFNRILCFTLFANSVLFAQNTSLADSITSLFAGSANCNTCHTPGFGPDYALTDSSGANLTPSKDWRSTMMANSARDPYWLAKVEAEINENPHLKEIIEDKCTTCHMPMGRTQALADGADYFSIADGLKNELAMDGVSCTVCHQIQPGNLGDSSSFSGGYIIDSSRVIFGPYDNLDTLGAETMVSGVQYAPKHGPHMLTAELCATCHTLYTTYVDNEGRPAGTFPEQMPYFEWKASSYAQSAVSCQGCHVPIVEEDIAISWLPGQLPKRNPLYKHQFVGGNTFMLSMLKKNGAEIGVSAEEMHFDSTIAYTRRQLQNSTANLAMDAVQAGGMLEINVTIENLAGHKFPTGYPGRRAWLHVTVTNNLQDTLFESGSWNNDGTINHKIETYATHFDTISDESHTQIYEAVMADVNGSVTQVLLRAASYIKDNRLPPKGFSSAAERYQDIAVRGLAENDVNFNQDAGGSDNILYRVDLTGQPSGDIQVHAELLYQSVNPLDIKYFRPHETEQVRRFLTFYDQIPNIPEVIRSRKLSVNIINSLADTNPQGLQIFSLSQNYPNPFNSMTNLKFQISNFESVQLSVYNLLGKKITTLVNEKLPPGQYIFNFNADDLPSGIYFYSLQAGKLEQHKKMLLLK